MPYMAKQKHHAKDARTDPTPKKVNRAGRAVTLWLSQEVFSSLEGWRKGQPVAPIRTDIIEQALVEFLARQGVRVPPPPEE